MNWIISSILMSCSSILYYLLIRYGQKRGVAEKAVAEHAQQAGVPTYTTLAIDDSKTHFPFDYMIISREPGNNMKNSGPYDATTDKVLIEDTGRLLALTHSVKTRNFGFFNNDVAKKNRQTRMDTSHVE